MDPLISLPATLYPSRVKTALLFLVCAVFAIGGVLMVRDGNAMGYFCGGFFALGLPVFGLQFHPRAAYLHLTAESFTFCSLFRAHSVRWVDVRDFGVIFVHHRNMVAWNFVPSYNRGGKMRRFNEVFFGYEAALPDTYGAKPRELANILNRLLHRAADLNPSNHYP